LSETKRWRLVSVVQRAGEHGLPGEAVVGEEEAVTEAIHAAAHPGRTRATDGEEEAVAASEAAGSAEGLSEDRGDATASRRSEDSASEGERREAAS
jgi:hypothetical protein